MRIDESTFLISGGASGLGLATARELVGQGGQVVLLDINAEAGQQAITELGDAARFVRADITREEDGRVAVAQALEAFGALHGLVNCAGIAPAEKVLGRNGAHGLDSFRRTVEVNLIGSFNLLRLAAEAMAQNTPNAGGERGVIINTAPVAAIQRLLARTEWALETVDLFEINEAFAVVPMVAMRELGIDHAKLNVHGGACALGHPIGASGARILVTLLAALQQRGLKRGVASVCIGGGEATAVAIELY